ncbi:MAG TPA: tail fiber protein [Longimicrobiales bacterium]|nr:tail fiber protein [Longimicrobiales bacterium]
MDDPYIAEIRMFSFDVVPGGFVPCDGRPMAVNQNMALFSLLGTTYGGDGHRTFGVPDLRGRAPLYVPQGDVPGGPGGGSGAAPVPSAAPAPAPYPEVPFNFCLAIYGIYPSTS